MPQLHSKLAASQELRVSPHSRFDSAWQSRQSSPVWRLSDRISHVAGGEENGARAFRAAIEQLLPGMMKMRANPRSRGEFAGAELRPRHAVDAAIPRTEIAVGEHAIGKLAAYF
jgi:hypothetical protein